MNRKTIAISAAAVLGAGLIGVSTVSAANSPGTLANKIASTFHLNASDVQKVIDQNHSDREAQHQQDMKARLDQAVKDGKITGAQETLIIDKQKELQSQRESLKDKTPEERRTAMQQTRTELEAWAKQNNIPLQYLAPFGRGMGHHMGMAPDGGSPTDSSQTQTN